jgi:ankyrin repeat protein
LDDIERRARLEAQNTVNDWLDVTKLNNQCSITHYYDKQISSCLAGTCKWVFSHPAYRAWISEEHSDKAAKILWICAPPGHGKTVLCAKLVEYLKDMKTFPVAYFFASPHAQSGGEPSLILRSWMAQIAQLDSNVFEVVRRHSETGQRASESAIWSLFGSVLSENNSYAFVLDGFDEYSGLEDARTEFLQKLKTATSRTVSRVLITSRDETDIKAELSPTVVQHPGHVMLQCRISNKDLLHDITNFSRSVVDKKLPNKGDCLRQDLAEQLAEKCEGMFLWIKLQQDQLRGGKNAKQLQNIVRNMPHGLEKTYERNWKIIQSHPPQEQNRALAILRWTTFALRPLTVSEITEALIIDPEDIGTTLQMDELPDNIDDEYIDSEIINICGALVEAREGKLGGGAGSKTIHLIHSSVREFLLSSLSPISTNTSDHYSECDQAFGQAEQHKRLTTICLGYLNCDDVWQQRATQETSGFRRSFNHYAARHWNSHLTAAGSDNAKLASLVTDFFSPGNKNFDHWRRYIESSDATSSSVQEKNSVAATPLYYAALFDLPAIMEHIWAEDPTQLNMVGGEYGIPLQAACFKGHESAFHLLIGWGADPNVQGGKFGTPMNAAIVGGQKSIVKALLGMRVDCSLQDSMGRTTLFIAAMSGDSEVVRWLIEAGAKQAVTNKCGSMPLQAAADSGHLDVVKLLLEKGADFTVPNNAGWTPVNTAANSGHLEVVKLLLKKGADLTIPNNAGWTPLYSAACRGYLEIIKLLLQKGANFTVPATDGWTPLNAAVSNGHLEALKLLLEKGADFTVPNNAGWMPLNVAASNGHLEVVKLLLEKGADFTIPNDAGWTPLYSAACRGYLEIIKLLLKKGADFTVPATDGWTPLNAAASHGHLEVVKLLLEKGADFTVPNNAGWTPLYSAACRGYLKIIKLLLEKGADFTIPATDGWTPLNAAVSNGHPEIVKLLLEMGADFTVKDKEGGTTLNEAADNGHLEVVKLLLEKGADFTIPATDGWTPLNAAASNGHLEVVKLLLEKGADFTVANNAGWTPLNAAVDNGNLEVVKLLLEKGADFTVPNNAGWMPLNAAADNGHLEVVKLLLERGADFTVANNAGCTPFYSATCRGYLEIIKLLLKKGADLTVPATDSWTPLNSAANNGHLEVVKLLLEKGVDFTVPDKEDWTPLNAAASNGHLEIVKLLLEKGADFTVANNNSWTPLYAAANNGHLEVVKLLLEKGADFTVANNAGWTPLYAAANNGHLDVAKLLLENGVAFTVANNNGWTPLHVASYKGHLDVVKLLAGKHSHIFTPVADTHGRNVLQLAARGGHVQTFRYLLDLNLGLDPGGKGAKGDGLMCFVSSGGSLEALNVVFGMGLRPSPRAGHWSLLHWACRAGEPDVVERLLEERLTSQPITISQFPGEWTPLSIALFHGNKDMLEKLSPSSRSTLCMAECALQLPGERHANFYCDGCLHVSEHITNLRKHLTVDRIYMDHASIARRVLTLTTVSCASHSWKTCT